MTGTGTLTMSGANTFSGNVTVNNGTLDYSGNSTLPAGNYTINGGTLNIVRSPSRSARSISPAVRFWHTGVLSSNAAYDVRSRHGQCDPCRYGQSERKAPRARPP